MNLGPEPSNSYAKANALSNSIQKKERKAKKNLNNSLEL